MTDNERDQAIEQAAKVLIDVSTEDVTADAATRLLTENANLRAERDQLQTDLARLLAEGIPDPSVDGPSVLTGDLARDMAAFANRRTADRDRAVAEMAALRDAIRALHQPTVACCNPQHTAPDTTCPECLDACTTCDWEYPCPTIRTLDGGQP